MKRFLITAMAVLVQGSLHAQQTTVDTMATLRALSAPTVNGSEAVVRGYYQVGDNTPQTYRWSTASTAADDGGAVINPKAHTGAGRWLLVWDGVTANVRSWGAYLVPNAFMTDAAHDSLPAINAAINALPIHADDQCEQPAGATATYHTRIGKLYFPGGGLNAGYAVSDEIRCTACMRVLGDGSAATTIAFLPGKATDTSNPKFVIRYLYNNGATSTNPNENFQTGVWGVTVGTADRNPGANGIKFIGSNGTYLIDVIADVPLESFRIDSKGVYFDRLMTGVASRGPGLEITGSEITGGYADIEHVNMGGSTGSAARDAGGNLLPAIWIHDAEGFSIQTIATESSPLSVRITNAQFGVIDTIHANPVDPGQSTPPADAAIVQLDGATDGINVLSTVQGPTSGLVSVRDNSYGLVNGVQVRRSVTYNPAVSRGSYYQDLNVYNETINSALVNGFLAFSSVGPASAYNFLIYQSGDEGVLGYRSTQNGSVTGLFGFDPSGNLVPLTAAGGFGTSAQPWKNVYAGSFHGSGAGLTNIPASAITGLVTTAGAASQPTVYQTGNYALADTDRGTRQVYTSSTGGAQATLGTPTGTAFVNGWYFVASNTGGMPMTVQAPAGRTIDGQSSLLLPPRSQAVITSDGTNYFSSLANSGGERLVDFFELTQDAASVSFVVPAGFHHLHLISDGATTASAQAQLLAQFNGDSTTGHYTRNYTTVESGNFCAGQDIANPGMYVGAMNAPTETGTAQSDAVISLGATTPNPSRTVSAVTNASATDQGQPMMINSASVWKVPTRGGAANVSAKLKPAAVTTTIRPGATVASMTLLPSAGNIAAGSTFYLYGY